MQYTFLGFQQEQLVQLGLYQSEATVLRWIIDFMQSGSMETTVKEGHTYYKLRYSAILKDLPILERTSVEGIRRIVRRMEQADLIIKHVERSILGSTTWIRFNAVVLTQILYGSSEETCHVNLQNNNTPTLQPEAGILDPLTNTDPMSLSKERVNDQQNWSNSISKNVFEVLQYVLPVNFRNGLSKDGKTINKTILKIEKMLNALYNHKFTKDQPLDPEWVQRNKINITKLKEMYSSWDEFKRLIKLAVKRFSLMRTAGYWPAQKNGLTTDFAQFIYNPRTQRSWLLFCIFIEPLRIKDNCTQQIKQGFSEEHQLNIDRFLQKHDWDPDQFWSKVKILNDWLQKNREQLNTMNTSFISFSNISKILERFSEFENQFTQGKNNFTVTQFGIDSKFWNTYFIKWCRDERGVNLVVSKK